MDFLENLMCLHGESASKLGESWLMIYEKSDTLIQNSSPFAQSSKSGSFDLGAKKSWVPVLGEIIWEWPEDTAARQPFFAYIFKITDGRHIGFVRIPNYNFNKRHIKIFGELMAYFENHTDALIIDQINNEGGSMFYMYALLSSLTNKTLALPRHQITISEQDYIKALEVVKSSENEPILSLEDPPSKELIEYSRFVVEEKKAGRGTSENLSNLVHLFGIEEVVPSQNPYTKKIVVLINELDFSAAEFFAAILQDNNRAILFGKRTAGAGGCVKVISYPEDHPFGIEAITYTWTIAWRENGFPIENVGVNPDVNYVLTAEDLQENFSGYKKALLKII